MHDERLLEIIDPPDDDMLKCFGDACRTCTAFFYCPAHWGE